jgi:uncharacterized protein YqiB (DUF1249 family)
MDIEALQKSIYEKLWKVIPDLFEIKSHGKSIIGGGVMDLSLDILSRDDVKLMIALGHYYKHPSGDMVADPDMEIAVYINQYLAEALSYQDAEIYRVVYSPDRMHVDVRAKRDLNEFLDEWLSKLIEQKHIIKFK